jgi:membrane-bound serine protease (ClpP class)
MIAILYLAGMALVFSEFFVPGLICGIVGVLLVLTSAWLGCSHYPDYAYPILFGELLFGALTVGLGIYLFPRSFAGKVMILSNSQPQADGWVATETDATLMGEQGLVFTALRPAGTVMIRDKRLDAVSDGTFIDKGAMVRVIDVQGSRVVVERVNAG